LARVSNKEFYCHASDDRYTLFTETCINLKYFILKEEMEIYNVKPSQLPYEPPKGTGAKRNT